MVETRAAIPGLTFSNSFSARDPSAELVLVNRRVDAVLERGSRAGPRRNWWHAACLQSIRAVTCRCNAMVLPAVSRNLALGATLDHGILVGQPSGGPGRSACGR